MSASPNSPRPLHVMLDARYLREKPSGIGSYVQALVARLPELAPHDRFTFWAHRRAALPLSLAENVAEIVVPTGPNSPWSALWPKRDASFAGVDVFHNPHNLLPRGLLCASVVTVHDVMALEYPRLHLRGLERLSKSYYYPQAIWRALRHATRLIAPSRATADRICALHPAAASRLTVIPSTADAGFQLPEDRAAAQEKAALLLGSDAPFLLVVGANTPSKRHDLALAAFARPRSSCGLRIAEASVVSAAPSAPAPASVGPGAAALPRVSFSEPATESHSFATAGAALLPRAIAAFRAAASGILRTPSSFAVSSALARFSIQPVTAESAGPPCGGLYL